MSIFKILEDEATASDKGCPFCFAPKSAISSGKIVVPEGIKNIPDKGYSFFATINPTVFECSVCGSAYSLSNDGVVYPIKQKLLSVDGVKSMPASINGSEVQTSIKSHGPNEYRAPLGLKFYTVPEELSTELEIDGISEEDNNEMLESMFNQDFIISEAQHFLSVDTDGNIIVISENDPIFDFSEWLKEETQVELVERLCSDLGISGNLDISKIATKDIDSILEAANGDPLVAADKMDELGLRVLATRTRAMAAVR